ncbi:MAG: radical SAM protein [Methanocellales archaeon]|nr:radical SAM protein [Methanocellales archaeon]
MNIYHITYAPTTKTVCLYFWGCNFDCRGCIRKKDLATKTLLLDLKEVIDNLRNLEIEKVVFMGGEPTIDPQLQELAELIHCELHAYNILLTNGFFLPSLDDIDEVCLSLKAHSNTLHKDFTGKSNKKVLENFVNLYRSGVRLRSESILIPNYIGCDEIENIARFIASVDPSIPYRIDAYTPVPETPWRAPMKEEVESAVNIARKYLRNVSCLKGDESLKYEVVRIV